MVRLREGNGDLVRDLERILENVGAAGKARGDLGCALEIETLVVAHPVVIAAVLPESDAEQHIVRVVIGVTKEVGVVCRDDGNPRDSGEVEDERVELCLDAAGIVRLDFEIVAVRKGVRVPERDAPGLFEPAFQQVRGDLPGDARRGDDEPLGVFGEQLAVHAGLGVEALGVRE